MRMWSVVMGYVGADCYVSDACLFVSAANTVLPGILQPSEHAGSCSVIITVLQRD